MTANKKIKNILPTTGGDAIHIVFTPSNKLMKYIAEFNGPEEVKKQTKQIEKELRRLEHAMIENEGLILHKILRPNSIKGFSDKDDT